MSILCCWVSYEKVENHQYKKEKETFMHTYEYLDVMNIFNGQNERGGGASLVPP